MRLRLRTVAAGLLVVFAGLVTPFLTASPASASCGWAAAPAPPGGGWSGSYQSTCWYTTTVVQYPKTYVSWEVPWWSSAQACAQGKGYKWADGTAYWTSLGCGTSGGGYVHWGQYWHQVADYHHIKTKSLMFPLGAAVEFQ